MYFAGAVRGGARCVFFGTVVMLLALLAPSEPSISGDSCKDPSSCMADASGRPKALVQVRSARDLRGNDGVVQEERLNVEFDCTEGEAANWNDDQAAWCCENKLVGCGFNCSAGYSKWQTGWSTLKKEFCCKNELLGCTFNCSEDLSNGTVAWPSIKKEWCCKNEGVGCGDRRPCLTQEDVLAVGSLLRGYTAPPGTPCMFGLDDRDEGYHCVLDGGSYGSFGWCYTAKDRRTWGACNEDCPLFGPAKKIGDRLKKARKDLLAPAQKVGDLLKNLTKQLAEPTANVSEKHGDSASEAKSDTGSVTEEAKKGNEKDLKNDTKADATKDAKKDGKKDATKDAKKDGKKH